LILIAIALPNFLESQMRAKIARVMSEQRSFSIAMESYFQDFREYPPDQNLFKLTSPIQYMAAITPDPFCPAVPGRYNFIHQYDPYYFIVIRDPKQSGYENLLSDFNIYTGYPNNWTIGPNDKSYWGRVLYQIRSVGPNKSNEYGSRYSPTNGTKSNGDLNWFGPFKVDRPYGPLPAP
ncbi:MAG: hypothetical protein KC978_09975, partial [Candidatus Omnitrophica bacterium]|nr:hypothetical protein [Candidatus Omnitrophota bacterium]